MAQTSPRTSSPTPPPPPPNEYRQPDNALHTNAQPPTRKMVEGIPVMSDGFPDSKKVSSVFDFMKLLTVGQWDQSRPQKERVDCYLYRTDPPIPWAKEPGLNAYVDKIFQPIDEDWIGMHWGGGEFRVRMVRGLGESRGDLYNQKVIIAGTPKDLNFLADERRKQRGAAKDSAPVSAVAAASTASTTGDALSTIERMQERWIEQEDKRRAAFDPMQEARKTVEASRELLTRPEVAKSEGPTMMQIFEMMEKTRAESRRETLEMMREVMKRDTPATAEARDPLQNVKDVFSLVNLIRGNSDLLGDGATAPAPVSFVQTLVDGAPKILGAVGETLDKLTAAQNAAARNRATMPAAPGEAAAPVPAAPPPSATNQAIWDAERAHSARMIVNMFPEDGEEYDEHGYAAAELLDRTAPEIAKWFAQHLSNPKRPTDSIVDPILALVMNHPHVRAFAEDFGRYFEELEAEASMPPATEG